MPRSTSALPPWLLAAALAACGPKAEPAPAFAAPAEFAGTIEYEVSVAGDPQVADLFRGLGPARERVAWGSGGRLRLETTGGLYAGIVVARFAEGAFFALDEAEQAAHKAYVQSLNLEDQPPAMHEWMKERLGPAEMERTEETGTYAGRRCQMYTVLRSGMLRPGATARACVAEDSLRPRPTRYQFGWSGREMLSPLPLQYGIREGLPLLLEGKEGGATVAWTAVQVTVGEPDDALFSVPAGYTLREGP